MRSILFEIPIPEFLQSLGLPSSFPIFGYGFFILIAFLVVNYWAGLRAKRFNYDPKYIQDISTSGLLAGVLGARVTHVVLYNDHYLHWTDFFKIYEGGLVLYGFLLTTPVVIYLKLKKLGISWEKFYTIFIPTIPLGIGIGRLGCFMNGCCYGSLGNQSWCVVFPEDTLPFQTFGNQPIHPSQIYAFILGLTLSIILTFLPKFIKNMNGFHIFYSFLAGYGCSRLIEEFFRADTPKHFANILTAGQTVSIGLIIFAIIAFYVKPFKKHD